MPLMQICPFKCGLDVMLVSSRGEGMEVVINMYYCQMRINSLQIYVENDVMENSKSIPTW